MSGSQSEGAAEPEADTSGHLGTIRRLGWGLGDQVLSSLTNFLLGVMVAKTVDPRNLGAFSLAYVTFTLSLGVVRALSGDLVVVRYSSVSLDEWRHGAKASAGSALMIGVIVGVGCIVAAGVTRDPLRSVFFILGLAMPALLVQDALRYAFFARGRGSAAFLNDLCWSVAMFAAFAFLMYAGIASVQLLTAGWAGAGCLAAAVGLLQGGMLPTGPRSAVRWLKQHRDLAPRFLTEFGLSTGTTSLIFFAIGGLTSLSQLGRLRAGQIVLSPLNILFAGAGIASVPEGVRFLRQSPWRLERAARWVSGGLAIAALAWAAIMLSLPSGLGQLLLGGNWEGARPLVLPLSIGAVGFGLAFGAMTGLRSLGAAKRSLRARWIDALYTAVLTLGGAYLGGVMGAAWGGAIAAFLRIPNAWWQFSRAMREYEGNLLVSTVNGSDPQALPTS
jgi:O-antigen/teichoic acid export membrane protein